MTKKSPSVFEVYAHEYDLVTNAAQREPRHAEEVAAITKRFKPTKVLDAGCASGLTTLLFARQGIETIGLDRSKKILDVAKRKRQPKKLPISYRYGAFQKLATALHGQFDLVVCLANAIAGVDTVQGLNAALWNFFAVLRPGGHLVLQMLNYAAVEEGTLMPVKATENKGIVYERFSERQGKTLSLYVTRADFGQKPPKFEVFRHRFENFTPKQVIASTRRAGFRDLREYGDLFLRKRFGPRSRDLVITAVRPK